VTFRWKDYRAKGRTRYKTMTLDTGEFMRRFLLHVLPGGFHRIRHYGLLANPVRRANLAKVRELLHAPPALDTPADDTEVALRPSFICRHCGAPMIVIDILARTAPIRAPPLQGRL
jgi:Putative transposase